MRPHPALLSALLMTFAACGADPGPGPQGPGPGTRGPCTGMAAGIYCGNRLGLDAGSRYACEGGDFAQPLEACAQGCDSAPSGTNDRCFQAECAGQKDGLYCGSDAINGNPALLYRCGGGKVAAHSPCPDACISNPPGTDDACGTPTGDAPVDVRAAAGNGFAEVRWAQKGGSSGYTVTAAPGGAAVPAAGSATSARVAGLSNGKSYTFTVRSGTGPASLPSNAVTPSAAANVIADVAFHPQERSLTCESAALRMALTHQGIVKAEAAILADIGVDLRASSVDAQGTLHWGDPYASFVGDPDGSEYKKTGYGTYYPNLDRVARGYGAAVLQAGEDLAPDAIYAALLAGHPAVAWIAYDWTYHAGSMPWSAFDGKQLSWHGPVEHAITLVGVTETAVLVNNPSRKKDWQWVTRSAFEQAYRTYGNMAVILR